MRHDKNAGALLSAAVRYLRAHPRVLVKAAADAASWRIGIPVEVIRWGVAQLGTNAKGPKDVELVPLPPALRVGATFDAVGTPLRASGIVHVDQVSLSPSAIRIGVRLKDLELALMGESDSPLAILIKSGMLDLSKLGKVLKLLPKSLPFLVEAEGDRVLVDLLRIPALADNARLRRILSIVAPLVGIRAIETEGDYLYVALRATPRGLGEALAALGL
jgi:hypothetical protein